MIDTFESLESRTLFATDPTFTLTAKRTLVAQGTSGNDTITVTLLHSRAKDGFLATLVNKAGSHEARFKFKAVKRIFVDGGGKNDSIFIGGGAEQTRPATVLGGAGNDKINYLCAGSIFGSGGSGDDIVGATAVISVNSNRNSKVIDTIFSAENLSAVNTLLGDAGNDTLSGDTNDSLDGGSGSDFAGLAVAASATQVPPARADALAALYFARIGVVNVEATHGVNLFG